MTTTPCQACVVQQGTHQPAEALHKIAEPDARHLQELAAYRFTVEDLRARVAELEEQLAAAPQAVQGPVEQFIESQHKLAAMTARAEHAEAKLDAKEFEAEAYRWLRDEHDWHAEPRLDAEDGTVWKLTMYSPQEIIDPTDDDCLDAAIRAALAAQAKQGEQANG